MASLESPRRLSEPTARSKRDLGDHLRARVHTMNSRSRQKGFVHFVLNEIVAKCGIDRRETSRTVAETLVETFSTRTSDFCQACIADDSSTIRRLFDAIEIEVKTVVDSLDDPSRYVAVTERSTTIALLSMACVIGVSAYNVETDDPFHLAIKCGHVQVAQLLLTLGWDINSLCLGNQSALHHAVLERKHDMISWLLDNGADATLRASHIARMAQSRMSALHCAAYQLDLVAVRRICERLPKGSPALLKKNQDNRVPLHFAVLNFRGGDHLDVIKYLCSELQSSLCAADRGGQIPLHYASRRGTVEVISALLDAAGKRSNALYDVCINSQDEDGRAPIHLAIEGRHTAAVEELCKRGCDLSIQTKDKRETPLQAASSLSLYSNIVQILEKYQKAFHAQRRLVSEETTGLKITKLIVCGDSGVGKTTLCKSLGRSPGLFANWIGGLQADNPNNPSERTIGISIKTLHLPEIGEMCVFDFGGEMSYYVTHSLFLGARNSIMIIVINLKSHESTYETYLRYWAGFIYGSYTFACSQRIIINLYDEKRLPKVILAASHADVKTNGIDLRHKIAILNTALSNVRDVFKRDLDFHDKVFYLDCRKPGKLSDLRTVLEEEKSVLESNLKPVPKLALVIKSKIRDLVKRFPKNRLPVMTFNEFVKAIQEEIVAATPDRTDTIAYYLDLIGEIICIDSTPDCPERLICLDPNVLCCDLVGHLLCLRAFKTLQHCINPDGKVAVCNVLRIFSTWQNSGKHVLRIFRQLQLCYTTKADKGVECVVIPALLSELSFPKRFWMRNSSENDVFAGRRLQCSQQKSILEYEVFSRVIVRLKELHPVDDPPVWANGIIFEENSARIKVQYLRSERAVDIVVRADKSCNENAALLLEKVEEEVKDFLWKGNHREVKRQVFSAYELKKKEKKKEKEKEKEKEKDGDGLECEIFYPYEDVEKAVLLYKVGIPFNQGGVEEWAHELLYCDCSNLIRLPPLYENCSVGLLPPCAHQKIQQELDIFTGINGPGWKMVAEFALGFKIFEVKELESKWREHGESPAKVILDRFEKERGTIGQLLDVLQSLQLSYLRDKIQMALIAYTDAGGRGKEAVQAAKNVLSPALAEAEAEAGEGDCDGDLSHSGSTSPPPNGKSTSGESFSGPQSPLGDH